MTSKYESVLSEQELAEALGIEVGNPNYLIWINIAKHVQQAVLSKLQPQLDAIGAGGVSGQRFTKKKEEWISSSDGRYLFSSDFTHDVKLTIDGDFENDAQRIGYANGLIAKLNAPVVHQVSLGGQPFRKQPVCYVEPACTIEGMGGHRVCKDAERFLTLVNSGSFVPNPFLSSHSSSPWGMGISNHKATLQDLREAVDQFQELQNKH